MDEKLMTLEAYYTRLAESFFGDLWEADARAGPTSTQFDKRNYVRAFFAYVEGLTALAKKQALQLHEDGQLTLTLAELALAREEKYELSDKGEALTRKPLPAVAPNTLFGLRLRMRQVKGAKLEPNRKDPGWQAFLDAIGVRNRITHPKSVEESTITDKDLVTVRKAQGWFASQEGTIFRALGGLSPFPKPPESTPGE